MNPFLRIVNSIFKKFDYRVSKDEKANLDHQFIGVSKFEKNRSNFFFPDSRMFWINDVVNTASSFINKNNIKGDFVECGVFFS